MSLLNQKAVREYILAVAQGRAHKFERVGGDVFVYLDEKLRRMCDQLVRMNPSVGKTVRSPYTKKEEEE